MYRHNSSQDSQAIQKDALISTLKKQLYELQDNEHQFINLNDEITNLESRYALLQDQREGIENQNRMKTDINRKTITQLRTQADNLKIQIHKCSVHIDDILRESAGIKRMSENRENQIAAMMQTNQDLENRNQYIQQQNKAKANKIKNLKDQRNKYDLQSQKLERSLDQSITNLKNLEKEARSLQSSNSRLDSILMMAEKDHSQLLQEVKSCQMTVSNTNKKLDQLNRQIEELKDKTNKLEKQCIKNEQQNISITENLLNSTERNKELTKKLKSLEGNLRVSENECDRALIERDSLESQYGGLSNEHKSLNEDIDRMFIQILEYERANQELNKEIENYINYDEEARNMLNRKDLMRKMLENVANKLNKTGQNIAHLR